MFMCCCGGGNVYWREVVGDQEASLVKAVDDWTGASVTGYSPAPLAAVGLFCFDRLNSVLFETYGQFLASRAASNFGTGTGISNTSPGDFLAIDCDPTNQRLFYITYDSGYSLLELRVMNYDGSGDTLILSWTGSNVLPMHVQYDLTLDRVYYVKPQPSGASYNSELRYVSPDGSGDTLVYATGLGGVIGCIAIDCANRYLFWTESEPTGVHRKWHRSDMGGGGLTTTLMIANPVPASICFSQSEQKLHIWDSDGVSYGTVKRMDGDGSNVETLVTLGASAAFPYVISMFALGEGLETTGSGAIL